MKKRYLHHLIALLAVLVTSLSAMAQEVLVNVMPKNPILPPQLLLYVNDPSQFFTVQLTNTTPQEQKVYLSLGIEHIFPNDGLYACTPDNYQPARPFVVPANGVYSLTLTDMKALYNHIPASAMKIPDGLIDGYTNGSFGLLPEGTYSVQFSAWRWTGNNKDVPYCLSGANSGKAEFRVCYMASAPEWMLPTPIVGPEQFDVCEVNRNAPLFGWTAPVQACDRMVSYSYVLKFVEVLPFQTPDVAMDVNPTILQTEPITGGKTNYIIPVNRRELFQEGKTYAAQIIATQKTANKFDYVMMTNDGKSPLRLFRMVEEGGFEFFWGEDELIDSLYADTKYTFRHPTLLEPTFQEGDVRKVYIENAIRPSWEAPWYLGGYGDDPEDLDFSYKVELYNGKGVTDWEQVINEENLIYSLTTSEQSDSIPWEKIKDKVSIGDFLLLRIDPLCTNDEEVIFNSDSVRIKDFVLTDHISPDYFSCTEQVEIDNKQPTTKSASDYKGQEIGIGQYQLVVDEIEGTGEKGFTGKGRVRWDVGIGTLMVHVKFKDMKINTDDIVYEGDCEAYENPSKPTNLDAVNSIFSDLGLEDLMANTSIPYADKITEGTKKLASEKIDGIADYYSLVKGGKAIWDMLVNGAETDVYLPLCLPKENKGLKSLNSSPVDIQITQLKFSPASATMNLIGEFTMPKSKCLASDLLVFGAPRLCISPDNILPEAGTLALLDNFTVKDPSSGYDCKFKAPKNLLEPVDGCYIAWKDYKFEILGIDMDMSIPKLKKVDEKTGEAKDELPSLHVQASIASWDDFLVDDITMDPFEVASMPGFTFKADKLTFDHSLLRNAANMASLEFPKEYKIEEAISPEPLAMYGKSAWEGFYMHELKVAFPKGLTGYDDERLSIAIEDMLIDPSGVTLDAGMDRLFQVSAGGFAISIDRIGLKIIQNNLDNCYLDGAISVPLIKTTDDKTAKIGVNCQIRKQLDDKGNKQDDYAYIFNTKSLNGDYKLDMFVAKLFLEEKLTYFLLESEPLLEDGTRGNKGDMDTRVELMLGGRMEIGGKDALEGWAKDKFNYDLSVPDVHFVGMRLANCAPWKSKYVDLQADIDKERADQRKNATLGLYTEGKAIHNGRREDASDCTFYFHTGSWSLASMSKKLGPFEFTLEDYDLTKNFEGTKLTAGLKLKGKVALVKGIDLSAGASITLSGSISNIGTNLSAISCDFEKPILNGISLKTSFCGFSFDGEVEFEENESAPTGKGFRARVDIQLPGDLFGVHGDGGYYEYKDKNDEADNYSWGYLGLSIRGKIPLGPCNIDSLGGAFYMNAKQNPDGANKRPVNMKGLVGVYMGLKMSTPDGSALSATLDMGVVYNRQRKCLSNFNMTGNVKAAGGIVNAKMTLVYENSELEKYLQLNITADAKLDNERLVAAVGDFAGDLGSIKDQLDAMVGSAKAKAMEVVTTCKAGLNSKIGAKAKDPNPDEAPSEEPTSNSAAQNAKDSEQKALAAKAGATVSLDVKLTWKSGGVSHNKTKWHVYLGQPDEDKRCSIVFIDFSTPGDIVKCNLGANMYFCLGNELPNDGQLPPIPAKISKFLDGSSHGDYVSDNASDAEKSRNEALSSFKTDFGAMLGAQIYGGLSINLGLIYGQMDAIAGFDLSMVHFQNGYCTNLGKVPGYNGWYGRGQIYAYLAMALGVRFNLGFVNYDLPLVKAGLGGLLKMGGPSPFYFQGKVRAKVELLGGLFKIDKSYSFDVGQTCTLFRGNALDNFKLFSDCTLGKEDKLEGWATKENNVAADGNSFLDCNIRTPQYIDTEAPLEEHFRVIDENELDRIASNQQIEQGSEEYNKFYMQACRTFIFHSNGYALLFTYSDPKKDTWREGARPNMTMNANGTYSRYGEERIDTLKFDVNSTGTRHYLNLASLRKALQPNKYYRLMVVGRAGEIHQGRETDPWTCDELGNNCDYKRWERTVCYYFRTKPSPAVADKAPLQDYVAVAYPSALNKLTNANVKSSTGLSTHMKAYLNDVQSPTIALTDDIRKVAFKKGSLYWRLLSPLGLQIDIAKNAFVEYKDKNGNVVGLNMEPAHRLKAQPNESYVLQLDYFTEDKMVDESGQSVTSLVDTTLVRLYVTTLGEDKDWRSGESSSTSCDYDKPFLASKLLSYTYSNSPYDSAPSDESLMNSGYYVNDPFWYIGYQSNFAFPGGWEVTERSFFGIEATTSESVIFQDPGGGGKYEGQYRQEDLVTKGAYRDYKTIVNKVFYTLPTGANDITYASMKWPLSSYWQTGSRNKWPYVFDVDQRLPYYNQTGTFNKSDVSANVRPVFQSIKDVYNAVGNFNTKINETAENIAKIVKPYHEHGGQEHLMKSDLTTWYKTHRGEYVTESGFMAAQTNSSSDGSGKSYASASASILSVPAYMFPTLWSVTRLEHDGKAFAGMSSDAARSKAAGKIWGYMTGMDYTEFVSSRYSLTNTNHEHFEYKNCPALTRRVFDSNAARKKVTAADVMCYRVNTYDFVNGHYGVNTKVMNGPAYYKVHCTTPLTSIKATVTEEASYNSNSTSSGTSTGTSVKGIDMETQRDNGNEDVSINYLSTSLITAHNCIMEYFKVAQETGWNKYKKDLSLLYEYCASGEKKVRELFKKDFNNQTATTESNNILQIQENCNAVYSRLAGYASIFADDISRDFNWQVPVLHNTLGYYYRQLNNSWDGLERRGNERSDDYKHLKNLYQEAYDAYTAIQGWYNECMNSTSRGGEAWNLKNHKFHLVAHSYQDGLFQRYVHPTMDNARTAANSSNTYYNNMVASESALKEEVYKQGRMVNTIRKKLMASETQYTTQASIETDMAKLRNLVETEGVATLDKITGLKTEISKMESLLAKFKGSSYDTNYGMKVQNYVYYIDAPHYLQVKDNQKTIEANIAKANEVYDRLLAFYNDSSIVINQNILDHQSTIGDYYTQLDKLLDSHLGRDREKAEGWLARISDINAKRKADYQVYLEGEQGAWKNIDATYNLYCQLVLDRYNYMKKADIKAVQDAADHAKAYLDYCDRLVADHTAIASKINLTSNDDNEVLRGIKEAGYDEQHELYKRAKALYDEGFESARLKHREVEDAYKPLLDQRDVMNDIVQTRLKKVHTDQAVYRWAAPVRDMLADANLYLDNPEDIYLLMSNFVHSRLSSMLNTVNQQYFPLKSKKWDLQWHSDIANFTSDSSYVYSSLGTYHDAILETYGEPDENPYAAIRDYDEDTLYKLAQGREAAIAAGGYYPDGTPVNPTRRTYDFQMLLLDLTNKCERCKDDVDYYAEYTAEADALLQSVRDSISEIKSLYTSVPREYMGSEAENLDRVYNELIKFYGDPIWEEACGKYHNRLNHYHTVMDNEINPIYEKAIEDMLYLGEHGEVFFDEALLEEIQKEKHRREYEQYVQLYEDYIKEKFTYNSSLRKWSFNTPGLAEYFNQASASNALIDNMLKDFLSAERVYKATTENLDDEAYINAGKVYCTSGDKLLSGLNNTSTLAEQYLQKYWGIEYDIRALHNYYDQLKRYHDEGLYESSKFTEIESLIALADKFAEEQMNQVPMANTIKDHADSLLQSVCYERGFNNESNAFIRGIISHHIGGPYFFVCPMATNLDLCVKNAKWELRNTYYLDIFMPAYNRLKTPPAGYTNLDRVRDKNKALESAPYIISSYEEALEVTVEHKDDERIYQECIDKSQKWTDWIYENARSDYERALEFNNGTRYVKKREFDDAMERFQDFILETQKELDEFKKKVNYVKSIKI